jgi:ribosomal protein L11 methyltransferase
MYLWRRFAARKWANRNEEMLRGIAGDKLTVIERPDRKRLQFEVASDRRADLQDLMPQFGGRIERLPDDWLKRALHRKTKPIKIGNRLIVANSRSGGLQSAVYKKSADWKPPLLVIPAGSAFGTGEHATTAMSLRLLEKLTRSWGRDRSLIDLGTGSGILALAAKCLGAKRVIGLDNDPVAIRTAKQNARLNKIRGVEFRAIDIRGWNPPPRVDIITANLFSELLVAVIPKFRSARRLILSGILPNQEEAVSRALIGIKAEIFEVCRGGKWVAMLAGRK